MGTTPAIEDQIKEINQKLDAIITALSIDKTPERNQRELKQLAGSIVDRIRRKEQNGYSPKKRPLGN